MTKTRIDSKRDARYFRNQYKRGGSREIRFGPDYRINALMLRRNDEGPVTFVSFSVMRDQKKLANYVGAIAAQETNPITRRNQLQLARSLRNPNHESFLP